MRVALVFFMMLSLSGVGRTANSPRGGSSGEHRVAASEYDSTASVVALMTDYGTEDFYVGALKGAILTACPHARIVDLTHEVPPYAVPRAAFELLDMAREFPERTIFVAIVDPGVGTTRRPVVLRTGHGYRFIGPDNGLFTAVETAFGAEEWRVITNPAWMRQTGRISTTFHGRDIFGPSAGHLACGDRIEDAGPVVTDPVRLDLPVARVDGPRIHGIVLFRDHYGNLQTNITRELVESTGIALGDTLEASFYSSAARTAKAGAVFMPLVRTYGDVPAGAFLAVVASTDRLEIAINQKSAGDSLGVESGAEVWISPTIRAEALPVDSGR